MATTTDQQTTYPGPFRTLDEIKRANRSAGHHFFDADTMRFFRSRIAPGVIGGRIIVTSEQFVGSDGFTAPRLYSIRVFGDDGIEETHYDDDRFEFQAYGTLAQARRAAQRYVSERLAVQS